jgi:hypothetical protein
MKKQILEVQEDPETGELMLEFPPELLNQMGWSEGDTLEWLDNKDGISWTISKKDSK